MSDLARWELRGPVRTLQAQFAEWNPEARDWWPLKVRFVATFRPDGQLSAIEHHNPDGSVPRETWIYDEAGRLIEGQWWVNGVLTRRTFHTYVADGRPASSISVDRDGTTREMEHCRYDASGRKTKVVFLADPEAPGANSSPGSCGTTYAVEGSDVAYSAPGAKTSTTIYDEHEHPSEVTFHDAQGAQVRRVVFSRDQDGHLLSERMEFGAASGLLGPAKDADTMPTDDRASLIELLETVFQDHTFSMAIYTYDAKGRRIQSVRRMGALSEERVSVRYDDFDNPVEEVRSEASREMRMENGAVKTEDQRSHVQHVAFEYQYDAYGNWTERIVSQRMEANEDDRPSNIERRAITYHEH